jgi:serine/threonine protein kinase
VTEVEQPPLLGGRYQLREHIGSGGMADVRRGIDVRLGRDVAVKVLRADLARDPSFQMRFRREAQAAASLNAPSIVSVYDTGEDPRGVPYIVMEHVSGRTLRAVLQSEGRLLPLRALEVTADICAALEVAHRAGIVHRDIKPANVMLTAAGEVKVMDFGIARAAADTSGVTQTAAVVGTAAYLSPEQASGEPGRRPLGRLLHRVPALRARHRLTAVHGRQPGGRRLPARPRGPGAAVRLRRDAAGRRRRGRAQGHGQEPDEPLPVGAGDARGPAAGARR